MKKYTEEDILNQVQTEVDKIGCDVLTEEHIETIIDEINENYKLSEMLTMKDYEEHTDFPDEANVDDTTEEESLAVKIYDILSIKAKECWGLYRGYNKNGSNTETQYGGYMRKSRRHRKTHRSHRKQRKTRRRHRKQRKTRRRA